MKRSLSLAVVLGLSGASLAFWVGGNGSSPALASSLDASTFTAKRGDLGITIVENGTLVAKESLKVVPQFRSEGKIVFLLEEGTMIEEGEVVCRLDSISLQSQVEQLEMDLVQAEAALVTARTELEIQRSENTASIDKAKLTFEFVRLEEEKYRDGDGPQERRGLQVAIKVAETEFRRADKNHEDSRKLVEREFIRRSELEQHEIELERATIGLETSKVALDLFDKYALPMTLRKNANAVKDAQRELEIAEKHAKSRINQKEADLVQAEKRIKRLNTLLEQRREDIANMTLRAPCPGILIYGDPRNPWYREQIRVGGTVWGGNTLMTIPDLRIMQVKLEVHEADINKLEIGQPALVTMDTYPGLTLHGEVARVANIAATVDPWTGVSSEVKRFDVEIVLNETEQVTLKPGISAKAEIHIENLRDVLFVPLQCVFPEDGAYWCLVATAEGPVRREVQVGLNNDTFIEILEGLEPGEKVMLYNPFLSTQGGSAVEESGSPAGADPAESTSATGR